LNSASTSNPACSRRPPVVRVIRSKPMTPS